MEKVYFTIAVSPGLVDSLQRIRMARKLGLSLGYVYIHTPAGNWRNTGIMEPLTLPWPLAKAVGRVYRYFIRYRPSIYDEIGLTRHFAREAETEEHPNPGDCERVDVPLGDYTLKKQGIADLEGLQRWIKEIVSRRTSGKPLLVRMQIYYPLAGFRSAIDSIPDSIDNLDLWAVYFEHRRERRKPVFPGKGLKTLVHIRQGDRAAMRTPWETWITCKAGRSGSLRRDGSGWSECRDESEFGWLTVADFHRFIRGLRARFDDNTFALSFFSDGFERFFWEFNHHNGNPSLGMGLLRKQMKALLKRRRDCARELKRLKETKNSVSTVGETLGKLVKLIDAAAAMELLIVGFPDQTMVFRMLNAFDSSVEKPPAVFLYKPVSEKRMRRFLEDNPRAKIIPVDVSAPDFDAVAARLAEFLPQLAPSLRSRSVGS